MNGQGRAGRNTNQRGPLLISLKGFMGILGWRTWNEKRQTHACPRPPPPVRVHPYSRAGAMVPPFFVFCRLDSTTSVSGGYPVQLPTGASHRSDTDKFAFPLCCIRRTPARADDWLPRRVADPRTFPRYPDRKGGSGFTGLNNKDKTHTQYIANVRCALLFLPAE